MNFMGMEDLFSGMGNELLDKSKSIEKIGGIKEIDKPIATYVNPSETRLDKNTDKNLEYVPYNKMENEGVECKDDSERVSGCPIDGHGGHWEGERGNSIWYPDRDEIPKNPKTNPDRLTWGQILDKYGIDGIPFKNGEPDFSKVSKGTVKIDNFSENRYGKGGNFDQACEKLAEQRGCTKEEVKAWMKENKYTWHEKSDCKTMQKVPTEIHGNIRHEGGISEMKNKQNDLIDNREDS